MRSTKFRWGTALVLTMFCFVQVYGSGIAPSAYQLIMQAGAALARRSTVNFIGAGVTCADNPGSGRTDCTITGGISASGVSLYSSTASATHAAASEVSIIGGGTGSLTLPAAYFASAGDSLIISTSGYYSTPIAPGTLRIRLKVGAATALDTGAWTPLPSITNAVWELSTRVTARSVGVGGTIMAQGEFRPGVGIPVGQDWPMLNTAAVALDTTVANTINLTAEWSAAGGETITGTNFLAYGVTTGGGISANGYATLQNATTPIAQRAVVNFSSGVYCLDNAGAGRSDCYAGISVANEAGTGTTVNKLAKLTGAPSTAIISTAGNTGGAVGIVVAGAGVAGSAVIATSGTVSCVFDGATTAGHYVGISAVTAGDCTNVGATYPTSGQIVGRVLSTNGGGGTYPMALFGPEVQASGSAAVLFMGYSHVTAVESTNSTVYVALATPDSVAFTMPYAGSILVTFSANVQPNFLIASYMGLYLDGGFVATGECFATLQTYAFGSQVFACTVNVSGVAAGAHTLVSRFKISDAAKSVDWGNRRLVVLAHP